MREDPRAGGDDRRARWECRSECGRSPRGRGRPMGPAQRPPPRGKIPARAGTTSRSAFITSRSAEDPRAGGDDAMRENDMIANSGRSPRGRGRLVTRYAESGTARKIPARAGTTSPPASASTTRGEDPRAGGDDLERVGGDAVDPGRSPRGRGRHGRLGHRGLPGGKIPARAGTTRSPPWPIKCRGGRSPRGRGRPQRPTAALCRQRKIPARAGTTPSVWRGSRPSSEDPRAGGDDRCGTCPPVRPTRRSPRGRGRRPCRSPGSRTAGKIPARAGTTSGASRSRSGPGEDPRAGGDDASSPIRAADSGGRSPRGRGRPGEGTRATTSTRKIPARAGTTRRRCSSWLMSAEDPRAGGDDPRSRWDTGTCEGRSPRGRGRPPVRADGRPR